MKLVVDTNTLISGALWEGPAARLLEAVAEGKARLTMSPVLLAEFADVVSRPRFVERIVAKATTPDNLTRKLGHEVTIVTPAPLPLPPELRDPKDLPVLECAVAARVDAIVSGDKDLLDLASFEGIPIISAREALRKLGLESA